jgi:YidC/Oxa1 family membrane protein insertase
MMGWSYWSMPTPEELEQQRLERVMRDSLAALDTLDMGAQEGMGGQILRETGSGATAGAGAGAAGQVTGLFASSATTDTIRVKVVTPLYEAVFTNVGGGPAEIRFLDYQTWDGQPVQLISDTTRSAYSLGFLSTDNVNVETQFLLFTPRFEGIAAEGGAEGGLDDAHDGDGLPVITIAEGETRDLVYDLALSDGSSVRFVYTLNGSTHEMDLAVDATGIRTKIIGSTVDFGWKPRLLSTERDPTQDGTFAGAYVYAGGEREKFKLSEPGRQSTRIGGTIDWVSTRTKFFTQIIKPSGATQAALLTGEMTGDLKDPLARHSYQSSVQIDIADEPRVQLALFTGPLEYELLKAFDESTYGMVDLGYAWMRWFADPIVKWLILPFFSFGSQVISNYGVLIILFALLVKVVLTPLTLSSFRSMAGMRALQPQLQELQQRHKDSPQKLQQETLKLYRSNKVNPLGGCLPMLLQFPILIVLWQFLQSSILIRQKEFLWAADLSAPDYLVSLPFSIPFLGDQIAGFVVLMAASIVLQTKVSGSMSSAPTTPGAPNMKVMMYIMPVMLLFFFNNFASGLSLYYLVFNVLSAGQQAWINRNPPAAAPAETAQVEVGVKRSTVMKSTGASGKGRKRS